MGFLTEIIRSVSSMISQALESEVKSLCRIIHDMCYRMAWINFAMLLMLLGFVFTMWGICSLLEPLVGHGVASVIIGVIVILVGLVIICKANACHNK
jgi:hypothetical protein